MSNIAFFKVKESFSEQDNDQFGLVRQVQEADRASREGDVYGFAKATCFFDKQLGATQWRVRTLQVNLPPLLRYNLAGAAVTRAQSQLKEFYVHTFSRQTTYKNEYKFSVLIQAIRQLIVLIDQKAKILIQPDEIKRKLNKLIIYLCQATSWPFPDQENTIENVVHVFSDYSRCILQGHLKQSNQNEFKKFVCALNKSLLEESMDCYQIGIKILTKSKRSPSQKQVYEQIKRLFKIGIERIHAQREKGKQENCHFVEDVDFFCTIFAFHAHLYKTDRDPDSALSELTACLDRLVIVLEAFDRDYPRRGSSGVLFDFFLSLLQQIRRHYDRSMPLGQAGIAPLAWTFEVLIGNQRLINYMRSKAAQNEEVGKIAVRLFFANEVWRAAIAFLIGLANPVSFENALEEKVKSSGGSGCGLNQTEIDWIFEQLNNRLFESDFLLSSAYKTMYVKFLNHLNRYAALHLLKPFARHPSNQTSLRRNLAEIGYDFMAEPHVPLDAFFGQVAYQALYLHSTDKSHEVAQTPNVRRSIVTLFTHFREERVGGLTAFKAVLVRLLSDFNNGLDVLGEMLICTLGTSLYPQQNPTSEILPAEKKLLEQFVPLYSQIRRHILCCVPLKSASLEMSPDLIAEAESSLAPILNTESARKLMAAFTEAFISFHQQKRVEMNLESWLQLMMDRMHGDGTYSFEERLNLITQFLQAILHYLKRSEEQMRTLFYPQGRLDIILAEQLRSSRLILAEQLRSSRFKDLDDSLGKLIRNKSFATSNALKVLSQLVSLRWMKEFEEAIAKCPLAQMGRIPFQFLEIERGKVWECLTEHYAAQNKFSFVVSAKRHPLSLSAGYSDLELLISLFLEEYRLLEQVQTIPLPFIWPNQALVLKLVLCEEYRTNNIFIKMGIGQGKSILTALTALFESIKPQSGCVLVLTRYPHLAKQGYAIGKAILDQWGVKSLCISERSDSSNYSANYRIIYADIESLDAIVSDLMLKLLQEVATPEEINFLQMIYGLTEGTRIILDEYDLILDYNQQKIPSLHQIPSELMPRNSNSPVNAWSLTGLASNASRVIGLASTATSNDGQRIIYEYARISPDWFQLTNNKSMYEIPYLQNTSIRTRPIQGITPCPSDTPAIMCFQKTNFDILKKDGAFPVIEESAIQSYCNAILEEIEVVRQEKQNTPFPYRRPIFILADPDFTYKNPDQNEVKNLWAVLKSAFEQASLPYNELIDHPADSDFQKIGQSGSVTLSAVKYGFGTDIQVDPVIEEGLHVIVATSVPKPKFLEHLIGRTGRMGGQGSYSAITIGGLICPVSPKREDRSGFYEALHQITAMFVKRQTSGSDQEDLSREWLLFMERSYADGKQIDELYAKALCGDSYQAGVAEKYLKNRSSGKK